MQQLNEGFGGGRPPVTVVDGDESFSLTQPPNATVDVLVAPEGISSAALRAAVVQHLGGSAQARLVLVRPGRRSRREVASSGAGSADVPAREAQPVSDRV
jgi:fructose-1,6-bisphosphatase/sedoheptulose 1,7-bisphosphatase-like protein